MQFFGNDHEQVLVLIQLEQLEWHFYQLFVVEEMVYYVDHVPKGQWPLRIRMKYH